MCGRAVEGVCQHHDPKIRSLQTGLQKLKKDGVIDDRIYNWGDALRLSRNQGTQTFFADPYCSWQRGSNENFNGLLRQYIPKKRRMETVADEELTMIQNKLNHRPRTRLGFKTPHEVFHASLNRVVDSSAKLSQCSR